MPDIYALAQQVCLAGRVARGAKGARWSDDLGPSGALERKVPSTCNGWTWKHDPADAGFLSELWYQDGTWDDQTFTPTHRTKVFEKVGVRSVLISGRYADAADGAWTLSAAKPDDADNRALPLTEEFLVGRFTLEGGEVATDALYPLSATIDSSLVLLFAYELRFKSSADRRTRDCELMPVDPRDYKHASFMGDAHISALGQTPPAPRAPATASGTAPAGTTRATELTLSHPRALVVVNFSGCEPRSDFEPGEFVEFTRFYPHVHVLVDVPTHQIAAHVSVKRPTKSSVYKPPASAQDESNHPEIRSILFSDTNDKRGTAWITSDYAGVHTPAMPFWYNFFDHHECFERTRATGQRYWVVRRWATERTIPEAIGMLSTLPGAAGGYEAVDVRKLARQGAYDNIHMTPLLRAPAYMIDRYPAIAEQLDRLVQAPVCSCDCLHMHWRWSEQAHKKHNQGWGRKGPHTQRGAPMVPWNQSIELFIDSDSAFTYRAYAKSPGARDWQVFMHHGTAFALRYAEGTAFAMTASVVSVAGLHLESRLSSGWHGVAAAYWHWSILYYHLRYRHPITGDTPQERLVIYKQNELETKLTE